jgi:hypothetical protein
MTEGSIHDGRMGSVAGFYPIISGHGFVPGTRPIKESGAAPRL